MTGVEHFDGAMYRRRFACRTAPEPWRSPMAVIISSACFVWRISETSVARYSGAAGSSTSTLIPPPYRRTRGRPAARPARPSFARVARAGKRGRRRTRLCAVLGQQFSVAGARTLASRLASRYGEPFQNGLPGDASLRICSPARTPWPVRTSMGLGVPEAVVRRCVAWRSRWTIVSLLDPGSTATRSRRLLGLRGIGPWTASYVAMRALGDPDEFLPTDLWVRQAVRGSAMGESGAWPPSPNGETLARLRHAALLWASLGEQEDQSDNREVVA